jgi:hypothetical protein
LILKNSNNKSKAVNDNAVPFISAAAFSAIKVDKEVSQPQQCPPKIVKSNKNRA